MDACPSKVFQWLYNNPLLSDCLVRVEEKEYRCHRVILATFSEYFKTSFEFEHISSISIPSDIHVTNTSSREDTASSSKSGETDTPAISSSSKLEEICISIPSSSKSERTGHPHTIILKDMPASSFEVILKHMYGMPEEMHSFDDVVRLYEDTHRLLCPSFSCMLLQLLANWRKQKDTHIHVTTLCLFHKYSIITTFTAYDTDPSVIIRLPFDVVLYLMKTMEAVGSTWCIAVIWIASRENAADHDREALELLSHVKYGVYNSYRTYPSLITYKQTNSLPLLRFIIGALHNQELPCCPDLIEYGCLRSMVDTI